MLSPDTKRQKHSDWEKFAGRRSVHEVRAERDSGGLIIREKKRARLS